MAPPNQRLPGITDIELKKNRENQAKQLAANAVARTESEMLAKKRLQEMQLPTLKNSTDFPPGFNVPPPPNVGEGSLQQPVYKNPILSETVVEEPSMEELIARREEEDAVRAQVAALRAANKAAQPTPTQQASKPAVKPKKEVPSHPILQQLRVDLGLDTQKTIDLTIADHKWSYYPLTPEMTTLAMRIADMGSTEPTERTLLQQYAGVCCSIVAIDGTPLWEVFSIEPEKDDDVSHPLVPKGRIRQRAALALLQELMTNSKLGVLQSLLEAYNDKVDPEGVVKGYTEYTTEKYYKFTCSVEGCDFHIVRSKRFDDANRELAYYCELHGAILNDAPVTDLKEGLSPLG